VAHKTPKKAVKKTGGKRAAGAREAGKKNPDSQGPQEDYQVGYRRPPKEFQWRPGQSGNPTGRTRGKSHLWTYFVEYLSLTQAEFAPLKRKKDLTMGQRAAIRAVETMPRLSRGAARDILLECFNGDEGKPTEHVRYEREETLTPEECEEIRRALRGENPEPAKGRETPS
jgi:hypothetical protein